MRTQKRIREGNIEKGTLKKKEFSSRIEKCHFPSTGGIPQCWEPPDCIIGQLSKGCRQKKTQYI